MQHWHLVMRTLVMLHAAQFIGVTFKIPDHGNEEYTISFKDWWIPKLIDHIFFRMVVPWPEESARVVYKLAVES